MVAILIRRAVLAAAILGLVVGAAGRARADYSITFDDMSTDVSPNPIPNGYGGFNWQNFYVLNGDTLGPSGFQNGVVSAHNVAFNGYADPASVSLASGTPFTFTSVYLTAAWNDGLNIQVDGYRSGTLVDTRTVVVDTSKPTLETFNYTNIDTLTFTSFGGTDHGYPEGDGGGGMHFVMDNFATAVPELDPGSMAGALTLLSGGVLVLTDRRRGRAVA